MGTPTPVPSAVRPFILLYANWSQTKLSPTSVKFFISKTKHQSADDVKTVLISFDHNLSIQYRWVWHTVATELREFHGDLLNKAP